MSFPCCSISNGSAAGVADSRDLLYFALMTVVPLFAATAVVAGRRLPARRRFAQWIPTLLAVVLAVVVYVLGQSWVGAWDLTGNKRYSLAPQTLQVLDALPENLANLQGRSRVPGWNPGRGRQRPGHGLLSAPGSRPRNHRSPAESLRPSDRIVSSSRSWIRTPNWSCCAATRSPPRGRSWSRWATDTPRLLQPEESALASAVYRLSTGKLARVCQLTGSRGTPDRQRRPVRLFLLRSSAAGPGLRCASPAPDRSVPGARVLRCPGDRRAPPGTGTERTCGHRRIIWPEAVRYWPCSIRRPLRAGWTGWPGGGSA